LFLLEQRLILPVYSQKLRAGIKKEPKGSVFLEKGKNNAHRNHSVGDE